MVANQVNYQMFSYVDDSGRTWNKRGELDGDVNAIDGSTPLTGDAPVWPSATRRYHTRFAVFVDPTTFRQKRIIVYTPTAFALITGATTLNVNVPGEVTPVVYSLSEKIGEKQPVGKSTRQLADHA